MGLVCCKNLSHVSETLEEAYISIWINEAKKTAHQTYNEFIGYRGTIIEFLDGTPYPQTYGEDDLFEISNNNALTQMKSRTHFVGLFTEEGIFPVIDYNLNQKCTIVPIIYTFDFLAWNGKCCRLHGKNPLTPKNTSKKALEIWTTKYCPIIEYHLICRTKFPYCLIKLTSLFLFPDVALTSIWSATS
jgi:hypothetical protein